MAIKKSFLESKWYYRMAKTALLLLPLFIYLYIYGVGYVSLPQTEAVLAEKGMTLGEVVMAIIIYYVLLKVIWRLVLYIGFGGLDDDMKKKKETPAPVVAPPQAASGANAPAVDAAQVVEKYVAAQQKHTGEVILWIIFILCIMFVAFYSNEHSSYVPGVPNPSPKCVPTGCGTNWYCAGAYYSNGVQKTLRACYVDRTQATNLPSWSGTCRRCP